MGIVGMLPSKRKPVLKEKRMAKWHMYMKGTRERERVFEFVSVCVKEGASEKLRTTDGKKRGTKCVKKIIK